jgi:predicted SAM-dependent methyltransferase
MFSPLWAGKTLLLNLRKVRKIFTRLDRDVVATTYLKGEGIEIGGLHNPLRVPRGASARYVDRLPLEELRTHYPELAGRSLVRVDILDDGETLNTIDDATQDFVIANHFIEHCENPLLALRTMERVLKQGGILFLGAPDKRYTFDVQREVTPFEHVLRDYREGASWSREQHFREWVIHVENVTDPVARDNRVGALMAMNYSIHYHVWTQHALVAMLLTAMHELPLHFDLELCLKDEGEIIVVLRKSA